MEEREAAWITGFKGGTAEPHPAVFVGITRALRDEIPSRPLPPSFPFLPLPKILQPLELAPPAEDQVFKPISPWETFYI